MLVPVTWLKEYADFTLADQALAERLTMAGLEVEEIRQLEGESVFVTYVTPNRSDLLSMVGVARSATDTISVLMSGNLAYCYRLY